MQAFCSATASSDAEGDCRLKLTRRLFFAALHSSLSAAFCARAVRSPLLMRHFSGRECRDPILWTGHEARTDPTYWKCVGCWSALALAFKKALPGVSLGNFANPVSGPGTRQIQKLPQIRTLVSSVRIFGYRHYFMPR